VGIANLRVHNDATEWFPDSHWFPQASRWADRALGGSLPVSILVDTGVENGLFEPAILRGIDALETDARSIQVGKARASASLSVATVSKEIHRALNGGAIEAYRIPDDRELVAQELLLFESQGPEEIEPLVDPQFRKALVTLMVPVAEQGDYLRYVDALRERIDAYLSQAQVSISGVTILSARSNDLMATSMVRSAGTALVLIAPVMLLVIRDIRIGLMAIVPNVVPVAVGIGFMHAVGVRLDIFTALIASLAMGIAVDDTIHFLHGFRQNYARMNDFEQAVAETLRTTGTGMVAMSITLSLGFLTFAAAEMRNVVHFGLVTTFVILIAMVAELHLSPALLRLVVEPRPKPRPAAELVRGEHGG
jgi:predicted RND superfamily exporter protein